MKVCKSCGLSKPVTEFNKHPATRDRLQQSCRPCSNEARRAWKVANSGRVLDYNREWRQRNRESVKRWTSRWDAANPERVQSIKNASNQRRRARKRGLPFELVRVRDVVARDGAWCWMCGVELADWDPAHLDHLIPLAADAGDLEALGVVNPGSVLANTALACSSCNSRKWSRVMVCAVARYLRNVPDESV